MKDFGAFIKKEFRHILRDKRTVLILLLMPMIQVILFGFALSVEITNINIAFMSSQKGETARKLSNKLDACPYFTIKDDIASPDEIDLRLQKEEIDVVVCFSEDFDKKSLSGEGASIQLIINAVNSNAAAIEALYLRQAISGFFKEKYKLPQKQIISPHIQLLYNPQMKSSYNFVPGLMGLILIIICSLMTSVSIVREKETGTMEVLLVSPARPVYIILAKMVPYFVISCINLITILLLAIFILGVPVAGSFFWLCIISLLYILLSLALGLLISTVVKTQVDAMLASGLLLMLPVMTLSGMIFPIESMPLILRRFSDIIPAKWYISAMHKLMIEGLSLRSVITEFSIIIAMTSLFIFASLKNLKNRL